MHDESDWGAGVGGERTPARFPEPVIMPEGHIIERQARDLLLTERSFDITLAYHVQRPVKEEDSGTPIRIFIENKVCDGTLFRMLLVIGRSEDVNGPVDQRCLLQSGAAEHVDADPFQFRPHPARDETIVIAGDGERVDTRFLQTAEAFAGRLTFGRWGAW